MEIISNKLLNWASDIDPEALVQASRTSRLPFVEGHVALMPDAHVGIGSTVGSVIPTKGAIIPAAVGVDIGCLDKDTEFLSPSGWIKICDYAGQDVLGYDVESDTAKFVKPLAYIVKNCDWFYRLKSQKGLDQMVTDDHKILFFTGSKARGFKASSFIAEDFISRHLGLAKGMQGGFKTAFSFSSDGIDLTIDQIRLQIMIAADGRLRELKTVSNIVEMHFKKQRKIDRCQMLLEDAGIPYLISDPGKDNSVFISFVPPVWTKDLSFLYQASVEQLKAVCEEVIFWDGSSFTINETTRTYYSSTNKANIDVIQFAFAAIGIRAGIYKQDYDQKNWESCYYVIPTKNVMIGMSLLDPPIKVASVDGKAYCFTMPTGYFVMRRGGNIAITGNCGMIAVETDLNAKHLPDSLDGVLGGFSDAIPAGVGKGHRYFSREAEDWYGRNKSNFSTQLDDSLISTCLAQFGTLGSGNHFVEICLDESDQVWIVLHSGSRGLGNKLAQKHISKAKRYCKDLNIALEDPDLAYFVQAQPEFLEYISDMLTCQSWALANREKMMDNALLILFLALGKGAELQRINCHHNFTQMERHGQEDLWITRKGAIKAAAGDLGIIPGSMGTKSYIVCGKGSPQAYDSCSHGAGRRLSRSKAKQQFTVEDLREQMSSVANWQNSKAEYLVDEIPSAYKDIDLVMQDQADLVDIVHSLKQVLNYKGT